MFEVFVCPFCDREVHRRVRQPLAPSDLANIGWDDADHGDLTEAVDALSRMREMLAEHDIVTHLRSSHPYHWLVYRLTGRMPRPPLILRRTP